MEQKEKEISELQTKVSDLERRIAASYDVPITESSSSQSPATSTIPEPPSDAPPPPPSEGSAPPPPPPPPGGPAVCKAAFMALIM